MGGQQTGSHVALIVGIWTDGDLKVFDPYFGPDDKVTYDFVCQARKYGKWEGTYYGFEAPARVVARDGQLLPAGIAKNSHGELDIS
jgi:hypothetical protein